jgi:hypothetical protein
MGDLVLFPRPRRPRDVEPIPDLQAEFEAFLERVEGEAPGEQLGPDILPEEMRIIDSVFELLEEELGRYDNSKGACAEPPVGRRGRKRGGR